VLAAGRGSRFGEAPKLLAHLHGKPLVRHVAEAALASAADPVFVVTGHRSGEVEAALIDLPVVLVPNRAYAEVCRPRSRPASRLSTQTPRPPSCSSATCRSSDPHSSIA
jgi:CTP:molybdopterin cytidylyltransferase MocA